MSTKKEKCCECTSKERPSHVFQSSGTPGMKDGGYFTCNCPCHQSESIEWEKDLSFRFDTWLKLYPGTPTIGEIEEWLLESLRISDECFSTNDHSKSESIEWKEALDSFIKKWVPGSYAHLSDNDENDGERLRTAIQDAITAAVEAREREISEAVDIVGIDCGCVLGKCKMCASIDFIKSEILSFITTAVAKRELEIAEDAEKKTCPNKGKENCICSQCYMPTTPEKKCCKNCGLDYQDPIYCSIFGRSADRHEWV